MQKPTFLDCPPRYTRTPRTDQSGADYGSAVERTRDTRDTGYSWLWWVTISAISIVGFVVVVATA